MDKEIPSEINVISLNCWGLKYLSKYRRERLAEIGRRIAAAEPLPHIVGLQECWTQEDYQNIRKSTKHILPFGKFYHSGVFGGGLVILSKWPIGETSMWRYPLNGRPTAFFRGDWYVGKGVACASIKFGPNAGDVVEVFTTHLHAPYEREPNDSYICHRTAQAWEIAKLMRGAAERGHLVLGLGDFNMVPQSLAHRLILTQAPVRDVWLLLHPESSLGATDEEAEKARCRPIPTGIYNLNENGATCDGVFNTWRWNKAQQKLLGPNKPFVEVPEDRIDPKARRLDYIFASAGIDDGNEAWIVKTARVGMLSRHPELQCSLSDHFSVEATLVRSRPHKMDGDGQDGGTVHNGVLLQPPATSASNSQTSFQFQKDTASTYLPIHIYDEILEMIHKYRAREERQRRLRLGHFVGSVIISIGCLVAVWWSPRNFVAFLLMLLSTLGLSAGVIDGLIGGLFFGWEIRALKEFEWEISNVRAAASGTPHVMDEEGIRDLW